jgi:hypothetical protein
MHERPLAVAVCLASLSFGGVRDARAAEAEPAERRVAAPPADAARPAKTGFQAHFRSGVSIPAGRASGDPGDTLARRYAWQIPVAVDLGAKVTRSVFVGSYLQLGFGAEGSDAAVEALCDDDDRDFENDISCNAVSVRLGLEAQYHFEPAARMNPWLGYGIGFEAGIQSIRDTTGYRENNTASGITWAQLSGGLDFRGPIGIGPFAELALGRYTTTRTETSNEVSTNEIEDRAWHVWTTLGLRMVVRP